MIIIILIIIIIEIFKFVDETKISTNNRYYSDYHFYDDMLSTFLSTVITVFEI